MDIGIAGLRERWRRLVLDDASTVMRREAPRSDQSPFAGFNRTLFALGPHRMARMLDVAELATEIGFPAPPPFRSLEWNPLGYHCGPMGRGPVMRRGDLGRCEYLVRVVMGDELRLERSLTFDCGRVAFSGLRRLRGRSFPWMADMLESFMKRGRILGIARRIPGLDYPPGRYTSLGWALSVALNHMAENARWSGFATSGDAHAFGVALAEAWSDVYDIGGFPVMSDVFPSPESRLRWIGDVERGRDCVPMCLSSPYSMECVQGDHGIASCERTLAALESGKPDYSSVGDWLLHHPSLSTGVPDDDHSFDVWAHDVKSASPDMTDEERRRDFSAHAWARTLSDVVSWDLRDMADSARTPNRLLGVFLLLDLLTEIAIRGDGTADGMEPIVIAEQGSPSGRGPRIPFASMAMRGIVRRGGDSGWRFINRRTPRRHPVRALPSSALLPAVDLLSSGCPMDMVLEHPSLH